MVGGSSVSGQDDELDMRAYELVLLHLYALNLAPAYNA